MAKSLAKELHRAERKALALYGSSKYHQIQKNHERIQWLRKKLGKSGLPQRISLAEILLKRMVK